VTFAGQSADAASSGAVQRKGDVSRHDWTVVTEITVEQGTTGDGRAQGVDAFGQVVPIDVEVNKLALDVGRYTVQQVEMDSDWLFDDMATRVYQGESRGSAHLVYVLPAHVKVAAIYTLVIAPRSRTLTQVWSEIKALPKSIQTFVIGKYGRAATLDDYERALRIGKQLQDARLTSDEIYQLGKDTSGKYTEKSIAASLATRADQQSARAANLAKRAKAESALFGREELYKRYLTLLGHFKRTSSLAAVAGMSADAIGVSPDLIKERDQLEADLVASDFPGGIADFGRFIDDYEKSFQSEALAYAMDVLLKYEHILHQEYDRYAGGQTGNMSAAAKTLSSLSKIREPAQELYGKAAHVRSLRKDLDRDIRDMSEGKAFGARAESASLGREAAIHESSADKLVKGALPDDPIVSWQDFPREKLVSKQTVEDVRYEIAWYISVHEAGIQRARQLLTEKPSRIYTLDKLLSAALETQDVEQGSIYDLIIQHRVAEIESEKKVKEILLAVLTVALTVVTFGGGTPALLASAAIVGVGGGQAYSAIEDYDTQTTFYVSQLLSQEPTAAWAVVAVVGLALDAGSLVSALKTVVPASKAFNATGDLAELGKDLAQVDPLVRESVLEAAEQARAAERQFKASVDQFKGVFTGAGGQAKAVVPSLTVMAAQKGGEVAGRLLAMTYYYIKTRLLKSFPKFLRQLEQDGLIVWAELAPAQQRAIRQAFDEALDLKDLPYGKQLYTRLSDRARQTYTEAAVDRFVAQGKAIGKTDNEIVAALEADLQSQERAIAAISSTERTGPGGAEEEAVLGDRGLDSAHTSDEAVHAEGVANRTVSADAPRPATRQDLASAEQDLKKAQAKFDAATREMEHKKNALGDSEAKVEDAQGKRHLPQRERELAGARKAERDAVAEYRKHGYELRAAQSRVDRVRSELAARGELDVPTRQPPQLVAGNEYNKLHAFDYQYRELYVRNPDPKGAPFKLDGYDEGRWIVSRKKIDLSNMPQTEVFGYIDEFASKYARGTPIVSEVPSSGLQTGGLPTKAKLTGVLRGQYVLEVPIQKSPVPPAILSAAKKADVIIRDVAGTVYRLPRAEPVRPSWDFHI